MPSITTPGIVLRHANYRDHDRMLTILSPHYGRLDVLSRGCRRPKSALMPASELFVHGEFVCYQQNDRATLSSCEITDTLSPPSGSLPAHLRQLHDRPVRRCRAAGR